MCPPFSGLRGDPAAHIFGNLSTPKTYTMRKYLLAASLLAIGMPLLKAQQVNFFMKIDGITGQSTVVNQAGNISVLSLRDSVDYQSHISGPGGGRNGERSRHYFTTRIPFDATTQQLQRMFESGKSMGKVVLTYAGRGNNANNANAPKFEIMVSEPIVSSLKLYTIENNPNLYVELTFTGTSIQYSYPSQGSNGGR
jgi:type VI protein secretion system component Hcp